MAPTAEPATVAGRTFSAAAPHIWNSLPDNTVPAVTVVLPLTKYLKHFSSRKHFLTLFSYQFIFFFCDDSDTLVNLRTRIKVDYLIADSSRLNFSSFTIILQKNCQCSQTGDSQKTSKLSDACQHFCKNFNKTHITLPTCFYCEWNIEIACIGCNYTVQDHSYILILVLTERPYAIFTSK